MDEYAFRQRSLFGMSTRLPSDAQRPIDQFCAHQAWLHRSQEAVLLLDEPTTGLDPATESRLIDDLLAVTRGKTLVMVTHQPRLTERADQVVRVDGGRITLAGSPTANRQPVTVLA